MSNFTVDATFPDVEPQDPSERSAMAGIGRNHRPPEIPAGIALPESTRPSIESYEAKAAAYDEARFALDQVLQEQKAAGQAAQRARVQAIAAGEPTPTPPAVDWSARIAEAEATVAAHKTVVDAAGRDVTMALNAAAGELHINAQAQAIHDRDRAAEALAAYEAAQAAAVSSMATLAHVDRTYLARRIPADCIVYRRPDIDEPSSADGRWLRDVVEHAAEDQLQRVVRVRTDGAQRWLQSRPETLDAVVLSYLEPFLVDEQPEPKPATAKGKRPKDKADELPGGFSPGSFASA
jgi:hypothetical protein